MVRYAVELYCADCSFGQDPLGCFDDGTELQPDTWDSVAEAKRAGWDAVRNCGPWEFRIVGVYDETETIPSPVDQILFDSGVR